MSHCNMVAMLETSVSASWNASLIIAYSVVNAIRSIVREAASRGPSALADILVNLHNVITCTMTT